MVRGEGENVQTDITNHDECPNITVHRRLQQPRMFDVKTNDDRTTIIYNAFHVHSYCTP
jgi:hypothetical protein